MIRLTDEQWKRIRDHFPEENIADGRPGRKPTPTRCVLEAVLWILNTGAQWHMLPQSYPNYKTERRSAATGAVVVEGVVLLGVDDRSRRAWLAQRPIVSAASRPQISDPVRLDRRLRLLLPLWAVVQNRVPRWHAETR